MTDEELQRAAALLDEYADMLRMAHTLGDDGPWDDEQAKADHDELRVLAGKLRGMVE